MENLKKKRSELRGDGRTTGEKIRAKKERPNSFVTAEDAELDEFLAILKRLQAGLSHFEKKGSDDYAGRSTASPAATGSGSLNPTFELGDFIQFQDGSQKTSTSTGGTLENDTVFGFDLNADPVSDQIGD